LSLMQYEFKITAVPKFSGNTTGSICFIFILFYTFDANK
jgi:hypothetical protein